jgi:hypothetical protein
LGYRYGYEFDGVDEYIDLGNVLDNDGTQAFSISIWFKYTNNSFTTLFSKYNGLNGFYIGLNSGGNIDSYFGADGSNRVYFLSSPAGLLSTNTWHNVVYTYDGSKTVAGAELYLDGETVAGAELYLDGVKLSKSINSDNWTSGSSSNSVNAYFGRYGLTPLGLFDGRMDDVQYYDFVLNSTQVSDIYNSGYVTAPTAAPIHHWKLGEDDTFATNWTVKDSVGSLDGTSVNMEEVDRKLGVAYSLDFDGVDERVNFGEVNNQDGSSAFSISCWVKTNTTFGFHSIVSKLSGLSPFNGYEVQQDSNKIRFFIIDQNNNRLQADSTNTLSTNTWYNTTFTYDGSKDISGCNLYINNGLETLTNTTNTFTGSADSTGTDFDIGSGQGSSYYWNGNIMEVSLYDTELSAADVALLFNETGTGNGVPIDPRNVGLSPTFYCPMVGPNDTYDGTNWTITDEIAGNNGTSVNMEEADKTSETP